MSRYVHVPLGEDQLFIANEHVYSGKDFPFHYHPEIELTCVFRSNGMRLVGDSFESYRKGDLVALGSNLPHQWQKNESFKGPRMFNDHIVVVHIHDGRLKAIIEGTRELWSLKPLMEEIRSGVVFSRETVSWVSPRMQQLVQEGGSMSGVITLLEILRLLSKDSKRRVLASPLFRWPEDSPGRERIFDVVGYLLKNYHREIRAGELAEQLNLSKSAFSHYFRKRTSKSFREYLTDIRLGNACKMLQESDKNVGEICFECGFGSISNFNKAFNRTYRTSPMQYRRRMRSLA